MLLILWFIVGVNWNSFFSSFYLSFFFFFVKLLKSVMGPHGHLIIKITKISLSFQFYESSYKKWQVFIYWRSLNVRCTKKIKIVIMKFQSDINLFKIAWNNLNYLNTFIPCISVYWHIWRWNIQVEKLKKILSDFK